MKNRAAIASGHAQSCEVATQILQSGGNVVDAAVATLCAMFITEPAMASPGGGGFATIRMQGSSPQFFDFFCHTPKQKISESELDIRNILVDFGDDQELFYTGNGTTAIPGMLAGMYSLHDQYGNIPMSELFQPAIKLMKEGVALDAFQQYDLSLLQQIFLASEKGREIFGRNGQLKEEGEIIQMPRLADFMEVLAIEGKDLFYKGEAGRECIEIHASQGGMITSEDLANYKVEVRKPLTFKQKGEVVFTTPLPFLGGPILFACLQFINKYNPKPDKLNYTFYKAFSELVSIEKDPQRLKDILKGSPLLPSSNNNGSTSHFSIVDEKGNAVSLTTSIGEGSGLFLPNSGIHMNNMLGELALLPGELNSWMPDVRLNSRMCPTLIRSDHEDIIAMGTGGAGRIPYVLAQIIQHGQIDLPRFSWDKVLEYPRVFLDKEKFHLEAPLTESDFPEIDRELKIWKEPSMFFGGVNLASLQNGNLHAAADRRRLGHIAYI